MKSTIRFCLAAAAISVVVTAAVFGQTTARALGMGGAYTALARGVHSPDWNPANLGLPDNPSFSFTIVSVGIGIENNSFTQGLYNQYATDAYWDPDEVANLLNQIPDDGLKADVSAAVRVLSFSSGRFALTFGVNAGGNVRVDKTLFEIPMQGTRLNTLYSFGNTRGRALGVARIALSYAQPMEVEFAEAFSLGGTIHFDGGGFAQTQKADLSLSTRDYGIDLNGNYEAKYGLSTVGMGLDFGAAAQMNKKWTLSLGFRNLISSVKWNKKVEKAFGFLHGDSLDVLNIGDIDKDSSGSYLKESPYVDSTWTVKGDAFSTRLPLEMRAGAVYRDGDAAIAIDYVQGFEDGPLTSTKPQMSLGTEWRGLRWLPLRMGVAMGGRIGFGTSIGLGLRLGSFRLDYGLLSRGFLFPKTSKGLVMALDMGFGP